MADSCYIVDTESHMMGGNGRTYMSQEGEVTKNEVIQQIDRDWQQLISIAKEFEVASQNLSGAVGHWSVKETLTHIAIWDGEAVRSIKLYQDTGEEVDYGAPEAGDKLNELQLEDKRALTLEQVWRFLEERHEVLLSHFYTLPDHVFTENTFTLNTISNNTYSHYREHSKDPQRFKG